MTTMVAPKPARPGNKKNPQTNAAPPNSRAFLKPWGSGVLATFLGIVWPQ